MRLWHSGAEWQTTAELDSTFGLDVSTTQKTGAGAASYRVTGSFAADQALGAVLPSTFIGQATLYYKCDLYVDSIPNDADFILYPCDFISSGGTNMVSVQIFKSGSNLHCIAYYNNFGSSSADIDLGIGEDTWFRFECKFDSSPANGSETFEIKINGSTIINTTNLNYTTKTHSEMDIGCYNGTASTQSATVYIDNISVNNASGSSNNSWVGQEYIVALVPTGAGDSNATAGTFASINEIPATTTASSSSNRIELDDSTTAAYFTITNPTTKINSYDVVKSVSLPVYIREESSGTTSYQSAIKSAAFGTTQTTVAADAGNTTVRVSPNGTTKFGRLLISEVDPTTNAVWKVTGTNSLTNAQIGVLSLTANDIWVTAMALMVAYSPGTLPTGSGMMLMF